jgi:hypothetical protein
LENKKLWSNKLAIIIINYKKLNSNTSAEAHSLSFINTISINLTTENYVSITDIKNNTITHLNTIFQLIFLNVKLT